MFKIMKSGFCRTNLEQIDFRKLLNLFLKYNYYTNNSITIKILAICFLRVSYVFSVWCCLVSNRLEGI